MALLRKTYPCPKQIKYTAPWFWGGKTDQPNTTDSEIPGKKLKILFLFTLVGFRFVLCQFNAISVVVLFAVASMQQWNALETLKWNLRRNFSKENRRFWYKLIVADVRSLKELILFDQKSYHRHSSISNFFELFSPPSPSHLRGHCQEMAIAQLLVVVTSGCNSINRRIILV